MGMTRRTTLLIVAQGVGWVVLSGVLYLVAATTGFAALGGAARGFLAFGSGLLLGVGTVGSLVWHAGRRSRRGANEYRREQEADERRHAAERSGVWTSTLTTAELADSEDD